MQLGYASNIVGGPEHDALRASPIFGISEIAAMSGLSAHTIRAWERRYQVVSPHRTRTNQRRYATDDLERLVRFKQSVVGLRLSRRLAALQQERGPLSDALLSSARAQPAEDCAYEPDDWRSAADLRPELIFVLDASGSVVDANIAVARATDLVRGRLKGLHFADVVDPQDRAKAEKIYRTPAAGRRDWALNLRGKKLVGLYIFDCRQVTRETGCLVVAVGRDARAEPRLSPLAEPASLPYEPLAPGGRPAPAARVA
jgi:DNA-binding transcriptional MerR regulator